MSNQAITKLITDALEDDTAELSTRDRLLAAGSALIAERGFNGVSVGDIEAAVGLAPRRGALYKHFPSKQALVEAAIEERINGVDDISGVVEWLTTDEALADLRGSLRLIAQVALDELAREKHVNQIIEKDGNRFPELRDRMRREMVEPGFRYAERALTAWVETIDGANKEADMAAVAAVALSALVHHRRQEWLLGRPPHDIETERFVETWVEMTLRALNLHEEDKK